MAELALGVILAGGAARRMGGGDKGLLLLGGRPVLAHVIERMAPQVSALALNANGDPARFAAFGVTVIPDGVPGQLGPLAGVLAGVDWAARLGAERIVTVPADAPFLPVDLVARLDAAGELAVAASRGQVHFVVARWPARLADALRAALARGERTVEGFQRAHGAVAVEWKAAPDPFFNINAPEDLHAAEAMLAGRTMRESGGARGGAEGQ